MKKHNYITILLGLTLLFLIGAPLAVGEVHSEIRGCLDQLLDDNDANDFTAMSDLTGIACTHLNEPAPNIQNILDAYHDIADVDYQAVTKKREMYFLIKATRRGSREASASDITDTDPGLVATLCQAAEEGVSRGERILGTDALKWFVNYSDTTIRSQARQYIGIALNDPSAAVRRRAVIGLGEAREPDLRDSISPKLSDPAEAVKYAAAATLEEIYGQDPPNSQILGIYRQCLDSTNVGRRLRSSRYFLDASDPDSGKARNNISQCLTNPRRSVSVLAASYLDHLPNIAGDPVSWGNFYNLFVTATNTDEPEVRLRALAALRDRVYIPDLDLVNHQIIVWSDCLADGDDNKAARNEACLFLNVKNPRNTNPPTGYIQPPNDCTKADWLEWFNQ